MIIKTRRVDTEARAGTVQQSDHRILIEQKRGIPAVPFGPEVGSLKEFRKNFLTGIS
jgi:hypothetical protein